MVEMKEICSANLIHYVTPPTFPFIHKDLKLVSFCVPTQLCFKHYHKYHFEPDGNKIR